MGLWMHPAFALASLKLEQLKKEHDRFLDAHISVIAPLKAKNDETSQWAWVSLTATGIEHVYTGIEGVLKTLVTQIDGKVHSGKDEYHKALLAQSLLSTKDRPAIIAEATHILIDELRGFRHAERNNYIHELRPYDVEDNYDRMNEAVPVFRDEVLKFLEDMSARYSAQETGELQSPDDDQE